MEDDNKPILYVLMRTDLPDYQPGKSMAQANHAGTAFVNDAGLLFSGLPKHFLIPAFRTWINEGNGFGTCIVLGCTYAEMRYAVEMAELVDLLAGIVHDPTYPIRDGHMTQTLPVDTCAYIFGGRIDCATVVSRFKLFEG